MQTIFSFINHYVCTNIFFKRCFDFIIALVALICLAPLLLIVTLWLHFANKGGGAFFLQERPGRHAKIFRVIKFKTMSDERDANGRLLPDEQRLTRVGRFVRSTSIDELPQFINVLKGDMSLIGPRPLLVRYLSPLFAGAGPPPRGSSGNFGLGAMPWSQRHQLEAEVCLRCVVRRSPLVNDRLEGHLLYNKICPQTRGNFAGRAGNNGGF